MLKLGDFLHLPQLDVIIGQLVMDEPGLVIVAGFGPRPMAPQAGGDILLPSGHSAIFSILAQEILEAHPATRAVVIAKDKATFRSPRGLKRRVDFLQVTSSHTYTEMVTLAARRHPGLLVIDKLDAETVPVVLEAALQGLRVLVQFDTVLRGAAVLRQLINLGVSPESLGVLSWIVTVRRLPTLCPRCVQPHLPDLFQMAHLRRRYPYLEPLIEEQQTTSRETLTFYRSMGCSHCQNTGRHGDVAVFDVFRVDAGAANPLEGVSLLSLEAYILQLAMLGHLSLEDLLWLGSDQLRRTYNLLTFNENALAETDAALSRKLAELRAANRVLQQRTEVLFSLQDIGQALIASTDLDNLAARVCRRAGELCGADRTVLYFSLPSGEAEILAVGGWDSALVGQRLSPSQLFDIPESREPTPFLQPPPGVQLPPLDGEGKEVLLRAGLRVPLIAQRECVGLMIVHSVQKPSFTPGEVALLRTFANQAALAIQRAGLIDELRAKIVQLETAQAELVKKERLERELELARQVQLSVLPRTFPQVPGYTFAARNQSARQVGGDFYDVIVLDEDHFGLVIADVSDKGMPAALYMALTRSLLLAEARRERHPAAVLSNVNRLLRELGEPDMFVSVFYGVVSLATRTLTYTRGGHDRPMLLRDGTVLSLTGEGAVLGILEQEDLHLSEEQLSLSSGDRLVLYTDGLVDFEPHGDSTFDVGHLKYLLCYHASLPPDELCAATFADLISRQGGAPQYDDMTMLVMAVE